MTVVEVYITAKDKKQARQIARLLLHARLVGCVNLWTIESSYWWKGEIVEGHEFAILAKTTKQNIHAIEALVSRVHSYDTPCIIFWDTAHVAAPYRAWLRGEVG